MIYQCNGLMRQDEIYLVCIAPRGSVLLHKTNNPVAVLYWLNCSSLASCSAKSSQNVSHQRSNELLGSCRKWDHKSTAFITVTSRTNGQMQYQTFIPTDRISWLDMSSNRSNSNIKLMDFVSTETESVYWLYFLIRITLCSEYWSSLFCEL